MKNKPNTYRYIALTENLNGDLLYIVKKYKSII